MTTQALALQKFVVEGRTYAAGSVITFADDNVAFAMAGAFNVTTNAAAVAAAVAGGAVPQTHVRVVPKVGNSAMQMVTDPVAGPSLDDAAKQALAAGGVALAGVKNWKRSNTVQIRAGLNGAFAKDLRSFWLYMSDSTYAGTGSNNNGLVNARVKGWIKLLADMLTAAGYQADENWSAGSSGNGTTATISTYDPRMAFGTAASLSGTYPGVAGGHWSLNSDAANATATHTARKAFDTLQVLRVRGTATGSYTIKDQAQTLINTINTIGGSNGAQMDTQTVPGGTTAVTLATTGGLNLIQGIGTRNSASPGMEFFNAGVSGIDLGFQCLDPSQGNNFAAARAAIPALMTAATKNVAVVSGGFNDIYSGFGRTLAQVQASLRSQLTFLKSLAVVPDIIVTGYPPIGAISAQQFADLNGALLSIAVDEFDVCALDFSAVMDANAVLVAQGLGAADQIHQRAGGQAMMARLMFDALMAVRGIA